MDQENICDNLKLLSLESEPNPKIKIKIDLEEFSCNKQLLESSCDYFKALQSFDSSHQDELVIKGGLDSQSFGIILDFLNDGNLKIDLSNFQKILQSCLFLQCARAEEESISFISQHLSRENALRIYYFSQQIFCAKLTRTCQAYIEAVFSQIFSQVRGGEKAGGLETFLETPPGAMLELLTRRLQCSEELLFWALLGWIDYQPEERRPISDQLIACIDFRLFSQAGFDSVLEEPDLQDLQDCDLTERLTAAQSYRALSLEAKISWWRSRPRSPRWPELVVVAGSSGSSSALLCCSLSKFSTGPGPVWRSLTKKPAELRRKSTGSCLVYSHPRVYFLGGEKHWSLHWYDLELSKWGVEVGLPPSRLLSGGCVLEDKLYLVGGVTLDQWDAVRGGAGSVNPSPGLDSYSLTTRVWSQAALMGQARSSPGVVALRDQIWVFGGLRRRQVLTSCCCYQPQSDHWTNISDLPEKIAYFSLVSAGEEVWILGGFGQDYTARRTTYCYDTRTDQYSQGPSLNSARKGAFSFVQDNNIYICGGSVDGMKFLDTIEVMNLTRREGWTEQKLNMNHFNTNMVSVTALLPVRFL